MASSYHLTVKKYLDQNKIDYSLPEYIQRGWNRIYTLEEKEFNKRSCIIGPDVQIPNSVVRRRLGTTQMSIKVNNETLRKAFELPNELFLNLSNKHKLRDTIEDEKLSPEWDDEDDDNVTKGKKSIVSMIISKQREKRRKYEDYKYDYDSMEPLSIDEIIEAIRTNIGKDLKNEDIKLITELMQIISRHKQYQIMNIYDELTDVQLISKFGGVPKLVQALQEIQRVFEQVAMKTNVASIETVIDVLLEKDDTYRVAVELLNSFNKNTKKNKQLKLQLKDKSGDISDHDHTVFNILIKDRISRLPASDLTTLIHELKTIQNMDTNKMSNDRDEQVKILSEQLNNIFTSAHLDGIKTALHTMKSSISGSLREYIDKIETSLKIKLTEHDRIIIESCIHDHLTSLNENELKIVYERLAQQGTLKRLTSFGELNQTITLGLMKKIGTDGLGAVIENIKDAQLDINSINELTQALTQINHYIQTQPSVSLEQIQNQLGMAYFIETRNLTEQTIHELSKAADLYSIAHISLAEGATKDECSTFLEHLKAPFIRICMQRIFSLIDQENLINLDKVSNKFYNERIIDLLNELIHGSNEFNRNLLFRQIKEQLKKNKELPDKLYRQMLKDKLIHIDTKVKVDTDKKKFSMIINEINRILDNEEEPMKQEQLVKLFDRIDIGLPERVKRWYKTKANIPPSQSSPYKTKKDMTDRKINVKAQTKVSHSKIKSVGPPSKTSRERIIREKKKMKTKSQISLTLKSPEEQQKNKLAAIVDQIVIPSSTTDALEINNFSKLQTEDDIIEHSQLSIAPSQSTKESIEYIDSLILKRENTEERDRQQPPDHQSSSNVSTSDTVVNNIRTVSSIDSEQKTSVHIDAEIKAKEESDPLQQPDDSHEKYFETNNQSPGLTKMEMFQVDLLNIRPEMTTDGKMGENNTFNFDLNHPAALLFYHPSLPTDPKQEINSSLSGKTAEFINDPPYEKTKARRILAKTIPTSTAHQHIEEDTIGINSSLSTLTANNTETSPPPIIESSAKITRRTLTKSIKQTEDIYMNSLTKALHNLFTRSEYSSTKLRKIHEELITSGHISPLNEFYRSTNEALRVTLDHCVTYDELIKWTLSLLQTTNKPNLIDFGHDLYSIAIELDLTLIERIDNTRCANEIQENLKHELQTITETNLREINSYLNAAQLEKTVNITKKLNVTSKERMLLDLNSILLHLIQTFHTFEPKYRPMQTRIREIAETFKSRAVADLARKMDEIEKRLSKTFGTTFYGISKRMNESHFILTK